jgi:5-carboxymethyl-2-hydroxymuconate isomerase
LAALFLTACAPAGNTDLPERRDAVLPTGLPAMNQFGAVQAQPPMRSNRAMTTDFLDLSFEMESGRQIARMSRFEGPVTITVVPGAPASLAPDLDRLVNRLRQEAGIDIRRVSYGDGPASITIETLPRDRMQRSVPEAACFVVPRVGSWAEFRRARSGRDLDWTTLATRDRVAVFIPSDVAPQEIRDCLHEEVAQALGPLNDLYRLPDSVFNDDNLHAVLTGFDMLVLRAYYDADLRSGMTRSEVAAALPGILQRLNPRGASGDAAAVTPTPRAWIDAIETALGPGSTQAARIAAADRAMTLARAAGLNDGRLAFSYFALGRLTLSRDVERSIAAFQAAANIYDRIAPGGVQAAHVDMQLAAFALSSGRAPEALRLTTRALPAAMQAQNASLLSTLMMIRAEALDDLGRASEARATRLDSLAWGRYGFGGTAAVGARLTEVAALSP